MKKLNFLSKVCWLSRASQYCDVSVDRRLTVGSPSVLHRLSQYIAVTLLLLVVGVGNARGANSGLTASPGVFVIDFYNSNKLTATSGTTLNASGCQSHLTVPTGVTASDVVTGVTNSGSVRYDMNGGLTLGTGTAAKVQTTLTIGSNYPIRKIIAVGTLYGTDAAPLYVAGTSVTLNAKQSKYADCSNSTTITPNFITSLVIKQNNGSTNKKRATLYTAVCEYGYRAYLTAPGTGSISAAPKTTNENGAGWNSTEGAVVGLKSTQQVTLTATPPSGYEVDAWTVKKKSDNSDVTASVLSGTTLTMPAYDVTVSVTWRSTAAGWKLKGSFDSWGDGYDMTGSGTVSVTRTLTANTRYEFKFVTGSDYYGNNGAIVHSVSDWTFATDKGNCVLYTGPAGDYTFSINTSTKEASITYPTVDHPNANYVYIKKGDGWSDARIYNWDSGSSDKMSDWAGSPVLATCEICGTTYYYGAAYFNKIIFRDGGSNQSNELSLDRGKWLDETTHASSWSTFATYTISFGGNGNTGGSMSDITGIACGTNQALTANAFTKTGYDFDGWKADVDVKISGSTVSAGTKFNGGVTLQDIRSDIELTAQWTPTNYTITYNSLEGATNSNPTSYTIESSNITLVDPGTRAGYTFAGWYTNEGKTTPAGTPAIATGSTGNKTFWAKWTEKIDTYKTALHTDSTGWTSYATGVTKSGAGYTIPAPSSVKKGATSSCEHTHYYFAGWVADEYKGSPADHIIAATGTTDATGTTYWAVWKKEGAGGGDPVTASITQSALYNNGEVYTQAYADDPRTHTDNQGNDWSVKANSQKTGSYRYIQMRAYDNANGVSYIQLPDCPGNISSIVLTVSSGSGNTPTAGSNTTTLYLCADAEANVTSPLASATGASSITLSPGSGVTTGYIKADGGIRIWDMSVTYATVSYEDPKVVCEACTADPVMTSAASALKGDFSLTSVGVTATGWNPGTNCSWDEKGFVWGSSANPTVSNNKVIVATGTDATWDGALVPSNSTTPKTLAVGTTYHFRAYGKNGKDAAVYVYSADVSFTPRSVTCGSVTGGTISAGTEVSAAGKTITLTATPANSHFTFNSWTIKNTSDNSDVTSSVSLSGQTSSATFTMPDYNVTITASFDEDAYATVNFYNAKNGNTPVSSIHVYEDEKPTPPTLTDGTSGDACDATSDKHYGWSTAKWNNTYATDELMNAAQTVYTKGSNLPAIAAGDLGTTIDYYAIWAQGTGSGSAAYKKVSSALDDYRGTYLIVFETDAICFDGSLTTLDAAANYQSVSIVTSGTPYYIASTSTIDTYSFTILEGSTSGKYYIQSASEYYIGSTAADGEANELLSSTTTQYDHTISVTSGDATITGTDHVLKCFKQAGQSDRFRYYKSTAGNVNMPQLYKYDPGITYSNFLTTCCEEPTFTIGGTGKAVTDGKISFPILREDLGGASSSTWAELPITISSNSSGTITILETSSKTAWKLSSWESRAETGGTAATSDHATFTSPSSGNYLFKVKTTTGQTGQGTYRIGIHQAEDATYCETTVYLWVDVTLRDKFVDNVNGNTTINVDGHGSTTTTPTESSLDADKDDDCHSTTRRLVGWVKETDMDSWYGTGQDRTRDLDDKTANITAPGATITTSGSTWYAVWGEEVVTP